MDNSNLLSQNLKAYKEFRNISLCEFSKELDIPKSTLNTILKEGNATLVTAIQIARAMEISLDTLILDSHMPDKLFILKNLELVNSWLSTFPPEKRNEIAKLISDIWEVISQ